MNLVPHLLVIATALGVTLVLTPVVRLVGVRWGIVAHSGGRHVHTGAIPRIGGVAMFAGFAAAVLVRWFGERLWGWPPALTLIGEPALGVLAGLAIMFGVGLLDDVVDLTPWQKLLGQVDRRRRGVSRAACASTSWATPSAEGCCSSACSRCR